ncbi:Lrp/AsnC family transcriptional regulator [Agrococcus baldri]|uniref:Transcriptional regulator n=1 Tax=Agrococcus baldri TaxID=153730 RepID=A0AA87RG22_9MICO|nr:Lrp/AsnC family transcriptional regulator [Agrococcus baldri]GEK78968.1 transcriptional regulator [Agrococcus baldri]
MSLDETDKAIVAALQRDGRAPYAAIAAAVGLSETAVRNRVKRLTEAGVMQIVAVTDPGQLGFARQAMIGVRTDGDLEAVAAALAALPEVDYVVITAGSYDVLAEVVCVDDAHLLELVSKRIRSIDGIRETDTLMYLKLQHETYAWGVR